MNIFEITRTNCVTKINFVLFSFLSHDRIGVKNPVQTSKEEVTGTSQAAVHPSHNLHMLSSMAPQFECNDKSKIQKNKSSKEKIFLNDSNSGESVSHFSIDCNINDNVDFFHADTEKDEDDTFAAELKERKPKRLENKAGVQSSSSSPIPMSLPKLNEANLYSRTVTVVLKSNSGATISEGSQDRPQENSLERFMFPLDSSNKGATTSRGKINQQAAVTLNETFTLPGTANELTDNDAKLACQKENATGTGHDTPITMMPKAQHIDADPATDPDSETNLDLRPESRTEVAGWQWKEGNL